LTIQPPNQAESLAIHEMFKSTIDLRSGSLNLRFKPENTVWMEETKLKNISVCHPEVTIIPFLSTIFKQEL